MLTIYIRKMETTSSANLLRINTDHQLKFDEHTLTLRLM